MTRQGGSPLRSAAFLDREALDDPAFAALVLTLPSEAEIAQEIGARRRSGRGPRGPRGGARGPIGRELDARSSAELFAGARRREGPTRPMRQAPAGASLRQAALNLLAAADPQAGLELVEQEYRAADNMTDRLAALAVAHRCCRGATTRSAARAISAGAIATSR